MIRLSREVRFSADRDWAGRVEFSRPVTNSWGGWPSAVGLVPYLVMRATVTGLPDPVTGYLCNITLLDQLLRRHAIPYACQKLSECGWRLPAERLVRDVWRQIVPLAPQGAPLETLTLLVTPHLNYAIHQRDPHMISMTQQFEFSAAHRLHCSQLSNEENRRTFGKCNNPNGHGHNYLLDVTIAGEPDEATGVLLPLPRFEQLVKEHVIDRLDHTHLNEDTAEFRTVNPSVENIARVIWGMLADRVGPARLQRVRVWETPKTWAEYEGT